MGGDGLDQCHLARRGAARTSGEWRDESQAGAALGNQERRRSPGRVRRIEVTSRGGLHRSGFAAVWRTRAGRVSQSASQPKPDNPIPTSGAISQ